MDIKKILEGPLGKVDPRIAGFVYARLKRIPQVRRAIEQEFSSMLDDMEDDSKPYKADHETFAVLPEEGRGREHVLNDMRAFADKESNRWQEGFVSGGVYHGQADHIEFLNEVYGLNSQVNPLHVDIWPSAMKFEAEIVSMTAHMLGAELANAGGAPDEEICGTVTSGGTESILLAMKTYRDRARAERGITEPEMVLPVTAHAAFDKAAQFFNIKAVKIPVTDTYQADLQAFRKALNRRTVVAVGSAPAFPHGMIDPIEDMSRLARARGIGMHVDACLGGFMLPWARELGYGVPAFDFRLSGVTSMSADTHKYGYAAKGTSVVLYRGKALRHHQFFTASDWPGGIYFSPTLSGSRPGALSAACWAAMVSIGASGYRDAAKRILETAAHIKAEIQHTDGLAVLGDPLWVIAFRSTREDVDIYRVMAHMAERGWSLNGLHKPSCVHLCVTLPHTAPGVADRFVSDLRQAVHAVQASPSSSEGIAPVYGMAATLPVRGLVSEMLRRYLDILYKV